MATPFNGDLEPGWHETSFDGSGLSSGVYFYRLAAGNYVETLYNTGIGFLVVDVTCALLWPTAKRP